MSAVLVVGVAVLVVIHWPSISAFPGTSGSASSSSAHGAVPQQSLTAEDKAKLLEQTNQTSATGSSSSLTAAQKQQLLQNMQRQSANTGSVTSSSSASAPTASTGGGLSPAEKMKLLQSIGQ